MDTTEPPFDTLYDILDTLDMENLSTITPHIPDIIWCPSLRARMRTCIPPASWNAYDSMEDYCYDIEQVDVDVPLSLQSHPLGVISSRILAKRILESPEKDELVERFFNKILTMFARGEFDDRSGKKMAKVILELRNV